MSEKFSSRRINPEQTLTTPVSSYIPPPFNKKNLDPPNCCDKELFLIRITFLLSPVIQQSGRSENVFNNPGMSDVEGRIHYFVFRLVPCRRLHVRNAKVIAESQAQSRLFGPFRQRPRALPESSEKLRLRAEIKLRFL